MINMGRLCAIAVLVAGCNFALPGPTDPNGPPMIDGAAVPPGDTAPPDTSAADAPPAGATTTDHVATADTWLHSQLPDQNFSGDHVVIPDGSPVAIALMQFDLTALAGAQVSQVELHIFTDFDPGAEVRAFPLTEAWSETEATFNQRANGLAWSTAGAAPPSRGTAAIATFTPSPQFTEFVVPFDTATVAAWVATPSANFGFAITSVNSDGPKLVSREGPEGTRPFLRITHTP
jgi:hypothetical protein